MLRVSDSVENIFSLVDKTVLITGGYRGIGLAITEIFAAAKANIVIASRNGDACQKVARAISEQYRINAVGMTMDVCNTKQVDETIHEVIRQFDKIDVLVNNSGIDSNQKLFIKMTDEDVNRIMDTNFGGTFRTSRAAAKEMMKQRNGKIINVASIGGKIAIAGMSEYCASKAAVIQLTRCMAVELASYGIQVNAICPGFFHTDMTTEVFSNANIEKSFTSKTPVKRIGNVDELKTTALYLATCPPLCYWNRNRC